MDNQQEYLTVAETAKLLRISRPTVYEGIRKNQIPSIKIGGTIRVPRDELKKMHTQYTPVQY